MVSRRLLRIKIFQVLYAYYTSENSSINHFEKELHHNIQKSYDLYHYLMVLLLEIKRYAEQRIELALNKNLPTHEDLNPNTRFITNRLLLQLEGNIQLEKYIQINKLSWVKYPELPRTLYNNMIESSEYKAYMSLPQTGYYEDRQFIDTLLIKFCSDFELLSHALEEQSIYWNDDLEFVISMVSRTLQGFREKQGKNAQLMPIYKNDDDRSFAVELFRKSLLNQNQYRELIKKHSENWEVERLALTDIIILQQALAELVNFQSIPVRVTLDEYIELAKYYSTPRSNAFINGMLDKMLTTLREAGLIKKSGRGLMGETPSTPNEEA
jgi:transcription antitermination protein NusB